MRIFCIIFILVLGVQFTGIAQSCLPGGINFWTQESIDNFQTNYPGCTEIEGYVFISHEVNNLDGISVLNSVGA